MIISHLSTKNAKIKQLLKTVRWNNFFGDHVHTVIYIIILVCVYTSGF